jgi:hypothetical protein
MRGMRGMREIKKTPNSALSTLLPHSQFLRKDEAKYYIYKACS